ncbi:DegT/DnrJ/EryC1/StrS family aminotransferase [Thermoactinomyces mirandus]|uniref:DegT/DnrJ/EryC1/StrS family aminotransferase n=1 Tax=Thermoactinomyces mirandus TaxID=2756294 RepID=A0A7W2ATD8_9BACL|nr:DegT/DnrJ/EryC1/StrS family aminotransferase [Thermoactinomyces mirandus]MBA4603650.1 DegT/DnrJ/EryC1/StrS family aminotransferase [Thermoactinomyces mirandus]
MIIDFFGLNKAYVEQKNKILYIIDSTLTKEEFLRGQSVQQLEKECSIVLERKYAIAVNSGTDALLLSLRSLGIGKGDEVIVSAFSFIASVSPILMVGATPVFIDIDPETYLMDLEKLESAITAKTKAIIAVQLYGQCIDPAQLESIAEKYNLWLIEDAAQAFGSERGNKVAGSIGNISAVSFDVSKVVGGLTTGGMVLTDDYELYTVATKLRSHGRDSTTGDFRKLGYNSQMSSINAAVLIWKISQEEKRRERRIGLAQRYMKNLVHLPEIKCTTIVDNGVHNFHKFVIRANHRDDLKEFLKKTGIETKIHYIKPLPHYEFIKEKSRIYSDIVHTEKASKEVLSLPIYPELQEEEVDYITDQIIEFYK